MGRGAGGAPDLVATLDGQLVVDVALRERLGGAREATRRRVRRRASARASASATSSARAPRSASGAWRRPWRWQSARRPPRARGWRDDVGADGGGDAVGGLVDRARDEVGGADPIAALDEREQLGVLVLEPLDGGVDRGHRARVVGRGAQRFEARLEDLEVVLLVAAQGSLGEHHLRLREVGVGERGVRVLGGHDSRHDAGRHALVRALERGDVDEVDRDDRGCEREDGAEAEAELDRQAHVPESGHAAGGRKTHAP